MKKMLVLIAVFAVGFTLLIACGSTSTSTINNPYTVKMGDTNFAVIAISIPKGSVLTFENVSSAGSLHILVVGRNGQNEAENGSPDFGGAAGHRTDPGNTWTTPPWSIAGTYHVTCTVHPLMNLTVTVTS